MADLLDEDSTVAGQKYCCLSFVSPEKIIKSFEEFKFAKFIDQYEWERSADIYIRFVQYMAYKYDIAFNDMVGDLADFRETEKEKLQGASCAGHYKTFVEQNEDPLLAEFNKTNKFQTAVRGLKVRGSYDTLEEAQNRAEWLRKRDVSHSIYVGQVGVWMPFHPEAYRTGRVEHLEKELNTLMHEKHKNEAEAKEHFEERIQNAKRKAIEENVAKAKETGNKLTQRLEDNGALSGANTMFQDEVVETYSGLKGELTGEGGAAAAAAAPAPDAAGMANMGHVDVASLLAADAAGAMPPGTQPGGGNPLL
jgi:hypothetical protein